MEQNTSAFAKRVTRGVKKDNFDTKNKRSFGKVVFKVLAFFVLLLIIISLFDQTKKVSSPNATMTLKENVTGPSGFVYFDFEKSIGNNMTIKYESPDSDIIFTIQTQDGRIFEQGNEDFAKHAYDADHTGLWIKTNKETLTKVKIFPTKK